MRCAFLLQYNVLAIFFFIPETLYIFMLSRIINSYELKMLLI